ncbi:hypothetical protein M413DRAFT_31816 [Hebeloma cylindrosporum]|uniref:Uncharacterized protein n=1 Tax=Hebeloma cylindrosporum TaxID=76867 RepID=A0A0C3BHM2_HEBCY|nr:hypothetical protein M413DRAFT_31816 [Hebeloma cylindrosporum h7]
MQQIVSRVILLSFDSDICGPSLVTQHRIYRLCKLHSSVANVIILHRRPHPEFTIYVGTFFASHASRAWSRRRGLGLYIELSNARHVDRKRIGPDNIRKVYLGTASYSLSAESSPSSEDGESTDTSSASMNQEIAALKAQLEDATAAVASMADTLIAKERAFHESEQRFSRISSEYYREVTEHHQTRTLLRARDSEIQRLREVQATTSTSTSTTSSSSTTRLRSTTRTTAAIRSFQAQLQLQTPTAESASPRTKELRRGSEIRFRGFLEKARTDLRQGIHA